MTAHGKPVEEMLAHLDAAERELGAAIAIGRSTGMLPRSGGPLRHASRQIARGREQIAKSTPTSVTVRYSRSSDTGTAGKQSYDLPPKHRPAEVQ